MTDALRDLPAGILVLDRNLRIRLVNNWLAALVGATTDQLLGQAIDVLLSGPSRILFQTHVYPALTAQGRVEEVFLTLASVGDDAIPVLLNASQKTVDGDTMFEAVVMRVMARSRWERDLLAATRALEQEREASDRLARELASTADDLAGKLSDEQRTREFRDAFIAVISHELRSPITTIFGMSHRLHSRFESLPAATVREHLGDIAIESDRLRRLTEDLLVLSRSEGGRLTVAEESLAIGSIVRSAVESESAQSDGHVFRVETGPGLPLVAGEARYVEQVVRNYLSNAVKYSPAGATIATSVARDAGGVAVTVSDSGPGLAGEVPERLFDLFYRAPRATRAAPGAGIGLFVCRTLIEAMGGRVWARDGTSLGGAEFGFWLPELSPTD